MKIAIFSDIHGNREALTSIIEDAKRKNISEIICLGDTIGIGPNPKECIDLIINNNVKTVLGNHELYFLKWTEAYDEMEENETKHHKWVKAQIIDSQKEYLKNCPLTIEKEFNGKRILFEHFLIDNNLKAQYPFYNLKIIKDGSIKKVIESLKYDLIFVGHEHNDFSIDNKLYDVGSSGCRKGNNTRYTILDTDTFNVETKIIEYDRESLKKDLFANDYPERDFVAKWFYGIEI